MERASSGWWARTIIWPPCARSSIEPPLLGSPGHRLGVARPARRAHCPRAWPPRTRPTARGATSPVAAAALRHRTPLCHLSKRAWISPQLAGRAGDFTYLLLWLSVLVDRVPTKTLDSPSRTNPDVSLCGDTTASRIDANSTTYRLTAAPVVASSRRKHET